MNEYIQQRGEHKSFNPLKVIIPILIALLSVSVMSQWYASNVTVPRYCKTPEQTLHNLKDLLDENSNIDNSKRRQHMIAAKLLFLHPRQENESKVDYIQRLRYQLINKCS
ncbi:MAG: hypothetical protein GY705_30440 [Bacteroidetes bacterium]|nr:hypothetical protein [Bacteroidota bacterium]